MSNKMAKPISNQLIKKIIEENGCFSLIYRRDRHLDRGGRRVYFYFRPHFVITLEKDKKDLLDQIKESLGVGRISVSEGQARLDITNLTELGVVIDLLRNHRFNNKSAEEEFGLFYEAVRILRKYRKRKVNAEKGKKGFVSIWDSVTPQDLRRLFRLREEMKRHKKWRKNEYKWTHSLYARPFI